ncbi:MAG TPA: hypothetical protein VF312_00320 [Propionibacteriaceae bacterium]
MVHDLLDVGGRVAVAAGAVFEEVEGSLEVCLGDGSVGRQLLKPAALLGGEGDALVDGVDLAFDFVDEDASELAACGRAPVRRCVCW